MNWMELRYLLLYKIESLKPLNFVIGILRNCEVHHDISYTDGFSIMCRLFLDDELPNYLITTLIRESQR